mgnify:CR=1 FL=1
MISDNYISSQNGFSPVQDINGLLDGRITKIVHVRKLPAKGNTYTLCDNEFAYGNITFNTAAKRIKKADLVTVADQIGITQDMLESMWPRRRYYYLYDVSTARFGRRRPISVVTNDAPFLRISNTPQKKHLVIDSTNAEDIDRLPYPLKLKLVSME